MHALKNRTALALVATSGALAAESARAQATTGSTSLVDFTSITNQFTPGNIIVGVLALGAAVMAIRYAIKGIKWLFKIV